MELWEILVPCNYGDGKPVSTKHHKEFDKFVHKISSGSTILKPGKGYWEDENGQMCIDRIIPVRIICTRSQIDKIVDFTIKHYKQKAVLAYKLSGDVILKYAEQK